MNRVDDMKVETNSNANIPITFYQVESNKRTAEESAAPLEPKKAKIEPLDTLVSVAQSDVPADSSSQSARRAPVSKARENRLEQNRKAARESRRRKKLMIEGECARAFSFRKKNLSE